MRTPHNHAIILGTLSNELLTRNVSIAFGPHAKSTDFKHDAGAFGSLLDTLTTFERGDKDGRCMLQGQLIDGTGQRLAPNM